MNITMKQISMMVFGSVAWLVCAVALPMYQGPSMDGLSAKVANLVIAPAYASSGDDEAKSDDDESKDDEAKSDDDESEDDDKSEDSSRSGYDFSGAKLVCISRSSVLTTLGFTSSEDEAKSDDDESKDDEAKSDDDESSDSEAKSDDESSDDEAKSDDDESKDDEAKSDDDEGESDSDSTEVTQASIEALSGCAALVSVSGGGTGTVAGVWIPSSYSYVDGNGTVTERGVWSGSNYVITTPTSGTTTSGTTTSVVLNTYFSAVGSGTQSATPSSTLESYREIRGE